MSLRQLPEAPNFTRPQGFQWDAPADLLSRWPDAPQAAEDTDEATITIFDFIGEDIFGTGVTARRISAALRSIGNRDVTVQINSPGGDVFEGVTIYNLLRGHPARVNVEIMGIAASAASVIAMAGDEIRMGLGTFVMVHNAWGLVIGNRHDMREAADLFEQVDGAMADIYEARTGLKRGDIEGLMDAETFLAPSDAVDKGFADTVDDDLAAPPAEARSDTPVAAKRRLDAILAQQGLPRSERRNLMRQIADMHDAVGPSPAGMPDAAGAVMQDADGIKAALERLQTTISS